MKIAVVQLTSALEPIKNIEVLDGLLDEITAAGIDKVFLPECFYSLSDGLSETPFLLAASNEHERAVRELAQKHQVYLLGGSAATKVANEEKPRNRSYQISPKGEILAIYDKMNLFAVDLSKHSSKKVIDEAMIYSEGSELCLFTLEGWRIGPQICFDLRFPELARTYSAAGAHILSYSSAFTVPTGKAHWHTLLRARAIENQCYVVASAQWGQNNARVQTYGHSLVVNPWGEIIEELKEGVGWFSAELSMKDLKEFRSRLNVLRNPHIPPMRDKK